MEIEITKGGRLRKAICCDLDRRPVAMVMQYEFRGDSHEVYCGCQAECWIITAEHCEAPVTQLEASVSLKGPRAHGTRSKCLRVLARLRIAAVFASIATTGLEV